VIIKSRLTCSAGITVGLINDIPTCQDLVARIVGDAETEIRRVSSCIAPEGGQEAWQKAASSRESKL
jgi:hypothetical protein